MKVQCINITMESEKKYIYTFREIDTLSIFAFPHEKASAYQIGNWYVLEMPK